MKQTVPSFLQPGDTIGISATARFATAESLAIAERTITAEGFNCYYSPEISMQHHQLAGTVAERVQHFNALIHNPNIKAIWNIRGGYGSAEIVDLVDWDTLIAQPKWLIGFSDFTTFLCHGVQKGIATLHAPMPISFASTLPDALAATFDVLRGKEDALHCILPKTISGQIIAGNLSVISSILGTSSLPSLDDCVLIIEDLDEYHYHLDRMLLALRRRGAFNNLRAVVLGEFSDIHDHDILWGPDVRHSLRKHFEEEEVPVYEHPIIGHGKKNWPIILRKV
ncbi:MAG: LD-carboxypeptidase [Bacteroidetes bacterium]|nr:LD-carboxypeptidase [Bacteroidota bacterium]